MINNFFFPKIVLFEISQTYIVEPGRPQMTIWRMRITCLIPKATNAHSDYVILMAFTWQQRLQALASVLGDRYIAYLV
jgi:hypothetical protein